MVVKPGILPTIHRTIDRARNGGLLDMACGKVDRLGRKDGSAEEGDEAAAINDFETRREGRRRYGRPKTGESGVAQWQVKDHAKQVRLKLRNQLDCVSVSTDDTKEIDF